MRTAAGGREQEDSNAAEPRKTWRTRKENDLASFIMYLIHSPSDYEKCCALQRLYEIVDIFLMDAAIMERLESTQAVVNIDFPPFLMHAIKSEGPLTCSLSESGLSFYSFFVEIPTSV
jgi:hypothetical protein